MTPQKSQSQARQKVVTVCVAFDVHVQKMCVSVYRQVVYYGCVVPFHVCVSMCMYLHACLLTP